ncbi:MAG: alanine racemase [Gammaproteobacteria bacterium]|nr:alanine racemase [Gammaproteobacteria bacterium]
MSRAVRACIDLGALRHNFQQVRKAVGAAQILSVVKADAYGHGSQAVATALMDGDGFGVASVDEAVLLRELGVHKPIVVFGSFSSATEVPVLLQHDIAPMVHCREQLELLEQTSCSGQCDVWIKIDTGMHRVGFDEAEVGTIISNTQRCASVRRVLLMSHLANADDPEDPFSRQQIATFRRCTDGRGLDRSVANSAGVVAWPASHFDWVRPGVMLYGVSPLRSQTGTELGLRPVMTLKSEVIALKTVLEGEHVGYGGAWTAKRTARLAVVACGYGDGYPRHTAAKSAVLIDGRRAPIAGRVSMDLMSVDVSMHPNVALGDEVILWGSGLAVEEVADNAATIGYEILCGVTKRVPRIYIGEA